MKRKSVIVNRNGDSMLSSGKTIVLTSKTLLKLDSRSLSATTVSWWVKYIAPPFFCSSGALRDQGLPRIADSITRICLSLKQQATKKKINQTSWLRDHGRNRLKIVHHSELTKKRPTITNHFQSQSPPSCQTIIFNRRPYGIYRSKWTKSELIKGK